MKRYIKTSVDIWSVPSDIADWGDYQGVPAYYVEQYIIRIYSEDDEFRWTIVDLDSIDLIAEGRCDSSEECIDDINKALKAIASDGIDLYTEGPDDIGKWYRNAFPDDDLGRDIPKGLTAKKIWNRMKNGEDIYDILYPADDSIVRERVFNRMASALDMDIDVIRNIVE